MTDRDDAAELHRLLAATAELPVERVASRWLGEAEAVAADAVGEDVPEPVVELRAGQVASLLANVESTGDDRADEHVAAARDLAGRLAGGRE